MIVFQLSRFEHHGVGYGSKLCNAIAYEHTIDMKDFMKDEQTQFTQYQLVAVIYHLGATSVNGHYICDCLRQNTWY